MFKHAVCKTTAILSRPQFWPNLIVTILLNSNSAQCWWVTKAKLRLTLNEVEWSYPVKNILSTVCPIITKLGPQMPEGTCSLQWRQNGHDCVSNHQPHDCLLNRLFGRRSKKTSKLRVTDLCVGNSPGTVEFPAQMACNAENVSVWWRHHVLARVKVQGHGEEVVFVIYYTLTYKSKCKHFSSAFKIHQLDNMTEMANNSQFTTEGLDPVWMVNLPLQH